MTLRQSLLRTAVFTTLYVLATWSGRLTIMDGTNLSLVWPAAGVGALWFICQRSSRWRMVDVAALAGVTVVVNMLTGASAVLAAFFLVANVLQAGTFAYLYGRWLPGLWGSGGTEPVSRPHQLWRLIAIAMISTCCGALVGPTGVWLVTGHYSGPAAAVWLARNSASMLLIGIAGLRIGAVVRSLDRTPGQRRQRLLAAARAVPKSTWIEAALLLTVSAAAYLGVFGLRHGLPLAFVLVTITVWAATRLSTTFVILHDLFFGSLTVVFTLHGSGQFAEIASHATRALVSQVFVAVVAVVGLAVALGRDERAALQKAAADQARMFATVIDAMGEGLAVLDADGNFLLRNPASAQLLGGVRSADGRMAGNDHYGLCHLDGTPIAPGDLPYQRTLATGDPHAMDILMRNPATPEGRILSVRATPLPISVAGRQYAVSVFSDVTADRRHRDELAAFAGVVAHDLSNPLTTVEGWAENVADLLGPDAGRPGDGIARIQRAGARMRNLINDLLAYATARDNALQLTAVDLTTVVTDIAVARIDQAETTGTPVPRLHIGELPLVHADPALIRQLLDNLIGNAVKYTAAGVVPDITVTGAYDGAQVRVTITDNGIGIPAGQHATVFDNFHRAHRDAGYAGTGLGLAICKRIVERHGGTIIAADAASGAGTVVTFTLPAADLPVRPLPGPGPAPAAQAGQRR
ncbi:signal transduction histidine kinase/integral membrane sensor domain MASE1 [Actinoplanes octamycinicus]|uniref:Sensor-like histidine kinase SenX3 n=1 Tax=Actinoplanes octamycinicus TaxID=135948 RepID=A0A7W7H219_9ACTN|nr:ATP-binding protein [Actinoplanes octamycinicus]MBB4742252.1 signal transduction histidine kinase/integral membrane sensor domain MASE1 [Actinoplanes octamycinicus]GIE59903.1 hypothetical protein Aoc01nite_53050 [Actinoplanes octamycinicus]